MTAGPQQYYTPYAPMGHPAAQAPRTPRRKRLVVAAVLAALAAVLAVVGMFLDYNSYVATVRGKLDFAQESGPWGASYTLPDGDDPPAGHVPMNGIALVLLLGVLLAGAVLAGLASSGRAAMARVRAARGTAIGYGTAAISIQLMLSLNTIAFLSHEDPDATAAYQYRYSLEPGFWVLLGMAVLAAVGMVLTLVPDSEARGAAGPGQRYGTFQQAGPLPPQQQYPQQSHPQRYQQHTPPGYGAPPPAPGRW